MARIESDLQASDRRMHSLVSEVGGIAGDVASQREHLYGLDSEIAGMQSQQAANHRLIQRNEAMFEYHIKLTGTGFARVFAHHLSVGTTFGDTNR